MSPDWASDTFSDSRPYRYRFWPKKHFPVGSSSTLELVAANGFDSSKADPACSRGHLGTGLERIFEQVSSFRSVACGFSCIEQRALSGSLSKAHRLALVCGDSGQGPSLRIMYLVRSASLRNIILRLRALAPEAAILPEVLNVY